MDKQDYYTKKEVKKLLKEHNISWKVFIDFIYGQTCPIVDSEFCYYTWDVDRLIRNHKKIIVN